MAKVMVTIRCTAEQRDAWTAAAASDRRSLNQWAEMQLDRSADDDRQAGSRAETHSHAERGQRVEVSTGEVETMRGPLMPPVDASGGSHARPRREIRPDPKPGKR